jgi:drug/metabolite transporter (DMT)-like permease
MAWLTRDAGAPWAIVTRHARLAVPAALASTASYLLILWVYTRAPIAPAAALRDTSAIFAMLIAALWLKERFGAVRLAALAVAIGGVALLRLG